MILGPDGKPIALPAGATHAGSHWLPLSDESTVKPWERKMEREVEVGQWMEKEMRVAALRSTVPDALEDAGEPIRVNARWRPSDQYEGVYDPLRRTLNGKRIDK